MNAPAAAFPVTGEILKALLDTIRTLSDYWKAVLLMGFILLLTFLYSLYKSSPNLACAAVLGIILIFMTALLKKTPEGAALARGQDERTCMILPSIASTNP